MYYENKKWYLYGITSFGNINDTSYICRNSEPSFFTKVPLYLDYIDIIKEMFNDQYVNNGNIPKFTSSYLFIFLIVFILFKKKKNY